MNVWRARSGSIPREIPLPILTSMVLFLRSSLFAVLILPMHLIRLRDEIVIHALAVTKGISVWAFAESKKLLDPSSVFCYFHLEQ